MGRRGGVAYIAAVMARSEAQPASASRPNGLTALIAFNGATPTETAAPAENLPPITTAARMPAVQNVPAMGAPTWINAAADRLHRRRSAKPPCTSEQR